ncbi:MAG: DUF2905 domain-containing protein [Gammaproteobacteria bacterium]
MSRWLILAGVLLVALGVAVHYAPWLFTWFGRLPGDIRIDSARGRVFVPITSMIIVSVLLTVLLHFLRR